MKGTLILSLKSLFFSARLSASFNRIFLRTLLASSILSWETPRNLCACSLNNGPSFCWMDRRLVISCPNVNLMLAKINPRCYKNLENRFISAKMSASKKRNNMLSGSSNWSRTPRNSTSYFLSIIASKLSIKGTKHEINLTEASPFDSQRVVAYLRSFIFWRLSAVWRSLNTADLTRILHGFPDGRDWGVNFT